MNTPRLNYARALKLIRGLMGPGARMWRRTIDGKQRIVVGFEQGSEKWQAGIGADYEEACTAALTNMSALMRRKAETPAEGDKNPRVGEAPEEAHQSGSSTPSVEEATANTPPEPGNIAIQSTPVP